MIEHPLKFNIAGRDFDIVMAVDTDNRSDNDMLTPFINGIVPEQDVLYFVVRALRPGDHAVDAGANIGFYTVIMSKLVGEQGHVTAFEPDPANVAKINTNLNLNNCTNVTVVAQPLWAERINKKFNLCGHPSWNTFLHTPFNPVEMRPVEVTTTTLEEVPGPLRLMKLDIEGSELPALCGAAAHIKSRSCPFIICEINSVMLKQLQIDQYVFYGMMRGHGYEVFLLRPDTEPQHIPKGARVKVQDDSNAVINVLFASEFGYTVGLQ